MASTAPAPITDPIDPASPLGRVITFFHSNRDESLTRSDAAAKLCCAPAAVDKLLTPGIQAGYIDTFRSPEDGYVWRAGKAIKTWKGAQVARPAAPGAGGARTHLPPLDASKLRVGALPLPPRKIRAKGRTKYDDVFALLTKPGTCATGIPAIYRAALCKAIQAYTKARPALAQKEALVVRQVDEETIGVWRVLKSELEAA